MDFFIPTKILDIFRQKHLYPMKPHLCKRRKLECDWNAPVEREGLARDEDFVVELVFPGAGDGDGFVGFEVLFCGVADEEDFRFSEEVGFEGSCAFDGGFEFVADRAHVAFN